uniref:ATP synthase F0 subunit 8 n=1 Tax=Barbronia yunnanensis TaxID=3027017 RepID=UPI0023D85BE1|nr:ATP synthase F0 subunit 8 [Barbronia yunnanensis]WDA96185.1 ATP synthase F0 subunit 8 [Barbronia yunnanensis]
MPHLSPMSWLLTMISLWLMMIIFTSSIWWFELKDYMPNIPQCIDMNKTWNW